MLLRNVEDSFSIIILELPISREEGHLTRDTAKSSNVSGCQTSFDFEEVLDFEPTSQRNQEGHHMVVFRSRRRGTWGEQRRAQPL